MRILLQHFNAIFQESVRHRFKCCDAHLKSCIEIRAELRRVNEMRASAAFLSNPFRIILIPQHTTTTLIDWPRASKVALILVNLGLYPGF